jgi:Leucine-rich repeat (LRR) protein
MMVSAIYPDGESIWIGPAWVHNPGREVEFRESSLVKALALQNIQPAGTSQVVIRTEGELADMRSLTIADPIDNFGILRKIPDLQALTINCSLAGSEDVELIQGLKNLQTLYLIDCKGDVLPDFKSLPKLVELGLRDSHLEDLAFVDDIRSLLALDLKGCTLEKGFTLPSSLDDLEHLRIEDMEVKTAGFLNKCINLRELKIVNCQLEEIRSGSENPHVIWLNLEKNQLKNTTFLGRFPNLKVFMAAHNQIWSLEMHAPLPWLYSIDLSYNQISKVSLAFDYKSLQEIILKDNQLIGIPGFYTVPNLRVLNVSGNDIEKLGRCVNTKIEVLNISSNRLNVLNGIELYSNLKTLLAVNNRISDLRPLLDAVNGFNPGRIDMRNNPVSKESFREVIPVLTGRGVSLQVPPQFEPASPCYPEVIVNEFNGSKNLQLKWQTDSGLPELGFDVYIGVGDTMWACSTGIFERLKELNLEKGQVYNWQVLARYNDTTFYSGQYRIEELDDMALQLPYYDNFEKYSPDAGISASSPVWKLTNGNNRFEANAVVSELTASYGQGKSLHIGNNSDVSLRLAHLETGYLRIEMDQYVIPGKASHVCLNNIAGLKIDLVSDGYNSGIYLNESAQGNIEIKLNAWNNWRIVFSGSNDYIKVECNDQQILFNHLFNDKMVRIGSMQFGPVPFETGLQVKEYESYIDNLAITDGSRSATSESILASDAMVSVFPNPANDYLYVEGLNTDQGQYTISIFATSGQLVKQVSLGSPGGRVQVGVSDLPCGNYVYQISLPEVRVAGGMFIVYR